ncbi:MAG: MFS transporter, partial [Dehalococcoidia bacterium]|nr:MFS transporter [Dehalococcoidia bacterium]
FGVGAATAAWVQTAFLLTLTSSLLVAGRLGDIYGHQNVYRAGIVLFTAAGTLSGFIQDIGVLITFRSLQGVGAAMISGNSLAIIANTFSTGERGMAIGIMGVAASMGGLLGVGLSTSLAQYLNWQWLFYMTLPVGLVGIVAARSLKGGIRPKDPPRVDYLGAILLAATLTAFSLSFSHLHAGEIASSEGWHYHGALLVATAVGLLLFVAAERRASQPLIELSYLLNTPFSFSIIANMVLHITMMTFAFLTPFLLEKGLGLSPSHTAGVIMSSSVGSMIGSLLSGKLYDRTRWRFFCPLAMASLGLGMGVMALYAPTCPYFLLMIVSVGLGLSMGSFNTSNNAIIVSTVPANRRGFATGMLETSRQFGHSVGASASGAVMGTALMSAAMGTTESAAYISGYQQASLVASGAAFLGILASLIAALSQRANSETAPVPAIS